MKYDLDWLALADNLAQAAATERDKLQKGSDPYAMVVTATAGIILAHLAKAVKESIRVAKP